VMVRASAILGEFEQAQSELVGKAVILTDGMAGKVEKVWLDELHGLRISIGAGACITNGRGTQYSPATIRRISANR
jgi:hypothetical protein